MSKGPEEGWRTGISSEVGAEWVRRRVAEDKEGDFADVSKLGILRWEIILDNLGPA